jgi:methylated-DNA-[protein]-cysteine S-methyltransferase
MGAQGHILFATPIGPCGLAWGDRGILAVQLPQKDEQATRARLLRRAPAAPATEPPAEIAQVAAAIVALLEGHSADLTGAMLDMDGLPDFDRAAYAVARTIPPGATITYGEIAARLGDPNTARAVGQAMGANPFPIIVPCHRVLGANGRMGGFSASGGLVTKARLLSIERARIDDAPLLFEELPIAVRSPTARPRGRTT